MNRKGEKIGWIGGWFGGFIWIGLHSVVWIFQSRSSNGMFGIALFIIAIFLIITLAPWRKPDTKYWKLMLPIYLLFLISIAVVINLYDGLRGTGLSWVSFSWLIPSLLPFIIIGNRKWSNNV
ncbi:MAG: hypothetical protein GY855_04615 [candidate division Zixibacteria bacterium]|nr:hypothetical protein [candidate division Zixibacteria bacterium]